MALALGDKHDKFTKHFEDSSGIILKFLHYPPSAKKYNPKDNIICGAHSDYGYLTLLKQDSTSGLQIKNKSGAWQDAAPIDKTFVVNIGDLMQRWTNDVYTSTKHRVINKGSNSSRYSIPYFVEPNYNTVIKCLSSCVSKSRPTRYDNIIAGDWINERFNDTYVYRQPK